jgi:hypothetical protein
MFYSKMAIKTASLSLTFARHSTVEVIPTVLEHVLFKGIVQRQLTGAETRFKG